MRGRLGNLMIGLCLMSGLSVQEVWCQDAGQRDGFPRPFSFREINRKNLPYLDWMNMVVSDLHLRTRQGAEIEFKRRYPDRPVLIQINSEGLGLWGTWICLPQQRLQDLGLLSTRSLQVFEELSRPVYPIMDFPGYWVYEAGSETSEAIAVDQEVVTVGVRDLTPFQPSSHPHSVNRLKRAEFMKDVVICPRAADGSLDWLRAEFGSIRSVDEKAKTITLRRWTTKRRGWRSHPQGTYVAPNANQIVMPPFPSAWCKYLGLRTEEYVTPFLPNVTRHCPRDPRTSLNAAEWLAQHYSEVKRKYYPTVDGFVFDVSAGTFHPSSRISPRSDSNVDGQPDYFYFDGIDSWALGMHDFFSDLRWGVPGKFDGLGAGAVFVSDANMNEESRFFDLLNGAEYEFGMVNPWKPRTHTFSSNLDRYLLWATRSRFPRLTYIHHKYPTDTYHGGADGDLDFYMHDNYYRLDIATACMGSGYVGYSVSRPGGHPAVALSQRQEQVKQYGTPLPLDWDEYHCGRKGVRGWLGLPLGPPVRLTEHVSHSRFVWQAELGQARLEVDPLYEARLRKPARDGQMTVEVEEVQPWRQTGFKVRLVFPVPSLQKNREYTLRFKVKSPSPYAQIDAKYASIPRNLEARLTVDRTPGLAQEALVFSDEREVFLTLTAPATGTGRLEFGLAEEPGHVTLSCIRLDEGCADILYRRFEHGIVLLNGSATTPFTFNLSTLLPSESYSRIDGRQSPDHNSGEPVDTTITLQPRDGILLKRI